MTDSPPTDALGPHAALVARLKHRVAPDERTKDDMREAADVIKSLTAELAVARATGEATLRVTHSLTGSLKVRLAEAERQRDQAEACIEQVRRYLTEERWDMPGFDPVGVIDAAREAPAPAGQEGERG